MALFVRHSRGKFGPIVEESSYPETSSFQEGWKIWEKNLSSPLLDPILLLERNLLKHLLHFMISIWTSWFYISQLEIDQGPGRFQPPCMTAMKLAENAIVGSEPTYNLRIIRPSNEARTSFWGSWNLYSPRNITQELIWGLTGVCLTWFFDNLFFLRLAEYLHT